MQPSNLVLGLLSVESKCLYEWLRLFIFVLSGAFVSLYLIQQNYYCLYLLLIACLELQYLTLDAVTN